MPSFVSTFFLHAMSHQNYIFKILKSRYLWIGKSYFKNLNTIFLLLLMRKYPQIVYFHICKIFQYFLRHSNLLNIKFGTNFCLGIVHKYCMVFIRFYTISIVSITERNRLKLFLKESSNN